MQDYIKVEKLTKKFGDLTAVENLSFTVRENEIFGFLGPNGAGKSTTLNIISTLLNADHGEILVDKYRLPKEENAVKGLIGVVPQEMAVYGALTVTENISFFASLYGLRGKALRAAVAEALDFVDLSEWTKHRADKLSGGMKRRLNIACGIAHNPKLIIMDEPTVGVDTKSRELIMNSIRTLRQRGATIIYTSHYMPEVQEICDRIAIIDKGKLAAIGTEQELLEVVTDQKRLIVDVTAINNETFESIKKTLSTMAGVRNVNKLEDSSAIVITVDIELSDITPLLSAIIAAEITIKGFRSEAPDLETTFLALTGSELNKDSDAKTKDKGEVA